jgi:hypothetical protein
MNAVDYEVLGLQVWCGRFFVFYMVALFGGAFVGELRGSGAVAGDDD